MRLGLGLGIVKSAASIYKGILDKYPNAVAAYSTRKLKTSYPTTLPADYGGGAAAAYSLRKVKSDYEGSAVKVRRSSDGELQDIGFDSNGNLDTTALDAFVNADVDTYTSDFSSTEDLNESNGTGAAAQSVGGVDDAYKLTCDSTISFHSATTPSIFEVGQVYNVSFKYYIPSGQTIDGIRFIDWGISNQSTLDEWVSVNETNLTSTRSNIRFFAADGTSITPSTNVDGDVFYLKDLIITQTTADGAVTKWYDQSGNDNDATNTTDSEQPLIVEGGNVVTENGKPTIKFDGADDYFDISNFTSVPTISQFNVLKPSATNLDKTFTSIQNDTITDGIFLGQGNLGTEAKFGLRNYQGGDVADSGIAMTLQQYLLVGITTSTTAQIYANGVAGAISAKARGDVSSGDSQIAANGVGGNNFSGKFQEVIIFASDQSTNRKDIEWNINNHYSIYDQWDRKSCMNVRRSSDNATQDIGFSGKNINQTQLESFVNDASPVLDDYTGAAAAYSLRKVRSAYTGNAIRVRRSSDDTEQDIGFDANGDLDSTALLAFVNESGNAYTSDFSSTEDLFEANGTGAAAQSVGGVDDAYKFTLSGGSNSHFSGLANFIDTGANVSVSFDYYIPSTNSKVDTIGLYSCSPTLSETQIDQWASVSNFETTLNSDDFYFFARKGTDPVSTLDADGDVFYLKNIVVTQTDADGAVTTFYDQSGNGNNATKSTATRQPLVVSGGSVITENGKAAIQFDGVDDELEDATVSIDSTAYSAYMVANTTGNAFRTLFRNRELGGFGTVEGVAFFELNNTDTLQNTFIDDGAGNAVAIVGASVSDGQHLLSTEFTTSSAALYVDGTSTGTHDSVEAGSTPLASVSIPYINIGGARFSRPWSSTIQEIILFDSDQSGNRLSIEGNIGRYYNLTGYRDGFVTKWYDQSGEYNHAENSTHDEQPQIVSNGSMLEENGKAAIDFDGVDDYFNNSVAITAGFSIFGVYKNTKAGSYLIGALTQLGRRSNDEYRFHDSTFSANGGTHSDSQVLLTGIEDDTNATIYANNTQIAQASSTFTSVTLTQIGKNFPDANVQEIIIFESDQSSNRTDIEKNINTHFKIYS